MDLLISGLFHENGSTEIIKNDKMKDMTYSYKSNYKFLNAEESRELNQFKSYLGAELSDNILAAQRHFPYFKQNWPIRSGYYEF